MGWISRIFGNGTTSGVPSQQNNNDMNLTSDYLFEKIKRAKEIAMARATVESYVKSVMPQIGLPYLLQDYENGVMLKIKMKHRRSLQIRLNRQNYVQSIQKLLPVINTLVNAFDDIGKMNIHVNGYHYSEKWIESELVENEQE